MHHQTEKPLNLWKRSSGGNSITSPLPDLTLELWDIPDGPKWLSPYPPVAGQPTVVSVLIKNVGAADVKSKFSTNFYVDNTLEQTWVFDPFREGPNKKANPLQPGHTIPYSHVVTLLAGIHTLRWVVDVNNEIEESDESEKSNQLEVQETWVSQGDLPDLGPRRYLARRSSAYRPETKLEG